MSLHRGRWATIGLAIHNGDHGPLKDSHPAVLTMGGVVLLLASMA